MGLHLHRADRTDLLADELGRLLSSPPADPFALEVVAVPARGIERWLSQRLSHSLGARPGHDDGVCAAVSFISPWALVAELAGTGDQDRWAPSRLTWSVLKVLDECLHEPWAKPLSEHLGRADDELRRGRRVELARRLATLLSSYAAQRPSLLAAWEEGRDVDAVPGDPMDLPADLAWQPPLWRAVTEAVGEPTPWQRHTDVLAQLRTHPQLLVLPARLSLFGHTRLSAGDVELLAALAEHRDVHLWLPHPSPTLWDDLRGAGCTRPVRRRADHSHRLVGHPLLAGLGRDLRELQRTLGAAVPASDTVVTAHRDSPDTLLAWLQQDVRSGRLPTTAELDRRDLRPTDRSVQVHACHGPARQVEVLREVLLGLLADDPTLQPRDIIVMCPDIEVYAPLVTATFGLGEVGEQGHPGHGLRVRLADRSAVQTNPLLTLIGRLLDLADGRAQASAVLDLAALAPVRRQFGFDDDDLDRITRWVTQTGVRWGFDAAHRAPYGVSGIPQNTWRFGLDRLLAGVAMSDDSGAWLGPILPLDEVASSDVELVGRLTEFIDRLALVTDRLVGVHPAVHWIDTLADGLSLLSAVPPSEHWQRGQAHRELSKLREEAGSYAAPGGRGPMLRRSDVRGLLAERLSGRPTRVGFRTGTLTVCTMVPMRSVPHRVIALVGLDDGGFPRAGVPDGDDLLARDPVTGERDPRSEDRQLLLDAILAAGQTLVVTYTGADPHTGTRRPPAVPLGELLDSLERTARVAPGARVADLVAIEHPLQRFDERNFIPGALHPGPVFAFDRQSLAAAEVARADRRQPPALLRDRLPAGPLDQPVQTSLADLVDFVRDPAKHFLVRGRLELTLPREQEPIRDELPVAVNTLQEWAIGDRLVADLLAGLDPETARQREWRLGELPPGRLGWERLRTIMDKAMPLAAEARRWRVGQPRTVDIDVDLGDGLSIGGTVPDLWDGVRLVPVGYSRLKPAERLASWVRVLALSAGHPGQGWVARTIGRPQSRAGLIAWADVGPIDAATATDLLRELVALREAGRREPLPATPKSSAAYAAARHRGNRPATAAAAALREWAGRYPERDGPAYELIWGSRPGLPDSLAADGLFQDEEGSAFGAVARRLWGPLLAHERLGGG